MQSVDFRDMDEFLAWLPVNEYEMVIRVRKILLTCLPEVQEKLTYNVPFYKLRKNICFIWPSSVLWGTKKSYEGVRLGFTQGYRMQDEIGYLDKGDRKQVCYRDFKQLSDIDPEMLRQYFYEAAYIDGL